MGKTANTGVFISLPVNNHAHSCDYEAISTRLQRVPDITSIWKSAEYPVGDAGIFLEEIKKNKIGRIIIAGDKPGFIKPFFTSVLAKADIDTENISLCDLSGEFPEIADSTAWAEAKLLCSVYNIPFNTDLAEQIHQVIPETLVIGGGIAGIQASLEIANSHNKVYLVERTGTIGGHMAMFDKTFPTLDCAACILTPKMVEAGQHPYIELITYSEVQSVSGIPGNYTVRILQKARRVNVNTCTGCGTCAEKCPSLAKSEFDAGTSMRKAIYIPFPQAVPNKYLIDEKACRYIQTGKCGVCVKVCPVDNCINLDEQDKVVEIKVGNIIVATGFQTFDASRIEQFGYGKYPNVLTSLELERLVNASGPTGGNICQRSQDKKGNWVFAEDSPVPKSLALIHCVGSRDQNYNKYCSRVCCMYSLKLAHLIEEKIPEADITEYYIDMRAFGKGYEEFYKRIENEGIKIIRGKTAKIEGKGEKLLLRTEDIENGRLMEKEVDMVVLAVGLEAAEGSAQLAGMLNVPVAEDGWLSEADPTGSPSGTLSGGIHLAGTCQGPKDIPDSVAQGSAAAAQVIQNIMRNAVSGDLKTVTPEAVEKKAMELYDINEA